ncbi:hypothetical protein CGCSCA4_v006739 [Colletotrichum siamense]|uniref:Uncharacterized protein n=1 Tax=Colletotrichum siamense TaxID=690259 RepID=A0A9P5K7D0_COLSI|nr:hypothetical protein CGCSCA4_v006739 [Colletotrichum siamense]KAF4860856.1 hypothetical protein CGCSCA2_v005027 [Colletotrichum siamense]
MSEPSQLTNGADPKTDGTSSKEELMAVYEQLKDEPGLKSVVSADDHELLAKMFFDRKGLSQEEGEKAAEDAKKLWPALVTLDMGQVLTGRVMRIISEVAAKLPEDWIFEDEAMGLWLFLMVREAKKHEEDQTPTVE